MPHKSKKEVYYIIETHSRHFPFDGDEKGGIECLMGHSKYSKRTRRFRYSFDDIKNAQTWLRNHIKNFHVKKGGLVRWTILK